MKKIKGWLVVVLILLVALVLGQAISFLISGEGWRAYMQTLPKVLAQIAFWGPIIAIVAGFFVWGMLRLLGFKSLEEIRSESVEQNNPSPAIVFVGTLLAALVFLLIIIRP